MSLIQILKFRYAPDTVAILSLVLIFSQFRYALDTVVILLLIQSQIQDTVQIRSKYGYHSDTFSSDLQLTVQQTFLDGIFKPISNKILQPLQMESLRPFPQLYFDGCKFMDTLVSNHPLPSSHERKNSPI